MPATPRFTVSQTDDTIVVRIKVPHVRVGNAETHVDGREFSFFCKPYLLRLNLPYEVAGDDEDSCKAVYDPADDNGTITATLPKATPGQHFPDLDLTTTLLQPRWTPKDLLRRPTDSDGAPAFSGVEVVSTEHYDIAIDDGEEDTTATATKGVREDGSTDASLQFSGPEGCGADAEAGGGREAHVTAAGPGVGGPDILIRPPRYGFNNKFSGFFLSLRDELREMIHLPDPENTPASARRGLRLEHEEDTFDADRYLGDLFTEEEDPLLTEALAFKPHWLSAPPRPPPIRKTQQAVKTDDQRHLAEASSSESERGISKSDQGCQTQTEDRHDESQGSSADATLSSPAVRHTTAFPADAKVKQNPPASETATLTTSDGPAPTTSATAVTDSLSLSPESPTPNELLPPHARTVVPPIISPGDASVSHNVTASAVANPAPQDAPVITTPVASVRVKSGHTESAGATDNQGQSTGSLGAANAGGSTAEAQGLGNGGRAEGGAEDGLEGGFTEEEQEQMRRLPNRDYLIPEGSSDERRVLLGLADVLFAYAYDHRTTGGDATVESAWTVAVLSPLLSWLEAAEGDVDEMSVALAGARRSLIFPYLRVWNLAALVVRDVRDILAAGKRCILRCLLQIYAILERGEVHYLLNKLFIEDYCVWIQKASNASLAAFARRYAAAFKCIKKSGVRLDLERLEAEAISGEGEPEIEGNIQGESSGEESSDEETSEEESSDEASSDGESSDKENSSYDGTSNEKESDFAEGGDQRDVTGIIGNATDNPREAPTGQQATMSKATPPSAETPPDRRASPTPTLASFSSVPASGDAVINKVARGDGDSHEEKRLDVSNRSAELLRLESSRPGGEASEIAAKLSLLNMEMPRPGGGGVAARGKSMAAGDVSVRDPDEEPASSDCAGGPGRRKNLIEEL